MPAPESNYQVIIQELVRRSNEETRRLRTVEQRLDTIEDKINVLIENTADRNKKIHERFAEAEDVLKTLGDDVANMKLEIEKINRAFQKFAQRKELKELEKMIELLSPARHLEEESEAIEVTSD